MIHGLTGMHGRKEARRPVWDAVTSEHVGGRASFAHAARPVAQTRVSPRGFHWAASNCVTSHAGPAPRHGTALASQFTLLFIFLSLSFLWWSLTKEDGCVRSQLAKHDFNKFIFGELLKLI